METVLLVPAYESNFEIHDYSPLIEVIENRGYIVVPVPIDWDGTIVDWARQLEEVCARYDPTRTVVAGFSIGADLAFIQATKETYSQLWLFSLSARFAEDIPQLPPEYVAKFTAQQIQAFNELKFDHLVGRVGAFQTLIVVGEEEYNEFPELVRRAQAAHDRIPGSQFMIASGAGHDVTHPGYLDAITVSL